MDNLRCSETEQMSHIPEIQKIQEWRQSLDEKICRTVQSHNHDLILTQHPSHQILQTTIACLKIHLQTAQDQLELLEQQSTPSNEIFALETVVWLSEKSTYTQNSKKRHRLGAFVFGHVTD